jgi:hypothetical protein
MSDPTLEQSLVTFLTALLGLAVTAITVVVIPWLRTQTSAARMKQARDVSGWVVDAVEQNYGAGNGTAKKEFARRRLMEWAHEMGVKLDPVLADTLIEAAVKGMNDVSVSLDVSAPATAQPTTTRKRGPDGRYLPKEATS